MSSRLINYLILILLFSLISNAQSTRPQSEQQSAPQTTAVVPRLIRFAGTIKDEAGKPKSGIAGITFSLYQNQEGGAALWMETQNVNLEASGRYTVLLGANSAEGVPMELFVSGEARWLGIRPENQPEQTRVLLLSVPYALKAGDADTLGGKPASAFMPAGAVTSLSASRKGITSDQSHVLGIVPNVSGSGTTNFFPIWTDNVGTLGNSAIYQTSNVPVDFGTRVAPDVYFYDGGAGVRLGLGVNGSELQFFVPSNNHFSFNKGGDLQASGTNELVRISSTGSKLNNGIDSTGTGIKHARTSSSCQTGNNVGDTCTVTLTWPGTAFANSSYTVVCSPENTDGNFPGFIYIPVATRTTTSVAVKIVNQWGGGQSVTLNGLDCIAMHD